MKEHRVTKGQRIWSNTLRVAAVLLLWASVALVKGQSLDVIQFSNTYFSALENSGAVPIQILRSGAMADYATVKVTARKGDGSAGTNDFQAFSQVVTFEPGQSNLTIQVVLINDSLTEGNEWFNVILSEPDPFCCRLGENWSASVDIQDNDQGIGFVVGYQVLENAGQLEVTLQRQGEPVNQEGYVTVNVSTNGYSFPATPGLDFIAPSTLRIDFNAGQSNASFSITILNDDIFEEWEGFRLVLLSGTPGLALWNTSTDVYIVDNDTGVEFAGSYPYPAFEDSGQLRLQLRRMGEPTNAFTVELVHTGTAQVGVDFTLPANPLVFEAGQTNLELVVPLLDDPLLEGTENIQFYLTNAVGIPLGRQNSYWLDLQDNETQVNMVDPTFTATGTGPIIFAALQPDGTFFVAEQNENYGRSRLRRINGDGVTDPVFFGPWVEGQIAAVAVQPDGKILCGGGFGLKIGDTYQYSLIRLSEKGALDTNFTSQMNWSGVRRLEVLSDGKILAAGYINLTNGFSKGIVRLTSEGLVDSSFKAVLNNQEVIAMLLEPDGRIMIGGNINISGPPFGLRRLSAQGLLDTTFNAKLPVDSTVTALAWYSEESLLLGLSGGRIVRVSRTNGDSDSTFQAHLGVNSWIQNITVQPDGKVLLLGSIFFPEGQYWGNIVRLNSDGTPDTTFSSMVGTGFLGWSLDRIFTLHNLQLVRLYSEMPGSSVSFSAPRYHVQEDRTNAYLTVIRGGSSSNALGVDFMSSGDAEPGVEYTPPFGRIEFQPLEVKKDIVLQIIDDCLLETNENVSITLTNPSPGAVVAGPARAILSLVDTEAPGSLDSFEPDLDWITMPETWNGDWDTEIALQADGKIVVGRGGRVARLNRDGSLDTSFLNGVPICLDQLNCGIGEIVIQPDGKLIVGGYGSGIRLHPDGTIEPGFSFEVWGLVCDHGCWTARVNVRSIILQPDEKFLLLPVNGSVSRFNSDSSVDPTFSSSSTIHALAQQSDGKLVVFNGSAVERLNWDGSSDTNFLSVAGWAASLAVLPDDRIIVGGEFPREGTGASVRLGRLLKNGAWDSGFDADIIVEGYRLQTVQALRVCQDGNVLVAGLFTDGAVRVVKLDTQGKQIPAFNSGTRFQSSLYFDGGRWGPWQMSPEITSLVEDPLTDTVLVAGLFDNVSSVPRPGLARLTGERSHIRLLTPEPQADGSLKIVCGSHVGKNYELQRSHDLLTWTKLTTQTAQECRLEFKDESPPAEAAFYRVIKVD